MFNQKLFSFKCAVFSSLICVLLTTTLSAATFYVDGAATDDAGDGALASPKKYITSGIELLNTGDTLIIKDGLYTGERNMIGDYANPRVYPPNGSSSGHTVIKAESIGGVIIDSEYTRRAFSTQNNPDGIHYVQIEGIHFRRGNCGVFSLKGNYNKVLRSGFEDGISPTSDAECPIATISGGSSYTLVEDSWIWGKGRYGMYTSSPSGGTNNIVFRRVVVRIDDVPYNRVTCGIQFYKGSTNVCQNCLVLDAVPTSSVTKIWGAFCTTSPSGTLAANNTYRGSIALNNQAYMGVFPTASSGTTNILDSVVWGNGNHGAVAANNSEGELKFNHVLLGNNDGKGIRSQPAYAVSTNVVNTISTRNSEDAFSYINSIDKVNYFGNGVNSCVGCTVTNGDQSDPYQVVNPASSVSLRYLVRIENGSHLKGLATDGGDIGATIINKIGTSGTLYGESGWNAITAENLWPWPDENIWLPKLRSYTSSGEGGNRGAAASGATLTSYVWGALDNTVPPFNVGAYSRDKGVRLQWDAPAATDLSSINQFNIYNVSNLTEPVIPGVIIPIATLSSSDTSYELTGLINGNVYKYAVTAVDSVKGESSYSYIVTVVPSENVLQSKPPTNLRIQ